MLHATSRNWKMLLPALGIALVLAAGAAARADDLDTLDLKFTGTFGLGYSSGDYSTTRDTDILISLANLGVQSGNMKFTVSVPYIRIDGRGLVVFDAAGNPLVIGRQTAFAPDVREGWGDLNFSATYAIPPAILDDISVKITGRVKLPTASERQRLSTGATDFALSVDVSREFGRWGPFITAGYLFPGQPSVPAYTLNDTVAVSVGTSIELEDDLVAILAYDYDSASSPRLEISQDLFGSLSWIATDSITLTGYGTMGLSAGSPSIGSGLLVSYSFN